MMQVTDIVSADDIERYIEGCLNDFEAGISTKEDTVTYLCELAIYIIKTVRKEDGNDKANSTKED